MRDYGKVAPQFWTQGTGKSLRGHQEAQIVALYLMTSPHSVMIGVFHQPKLYISHEAGLSMEAVAKGLAKCVEVGFCLYDEESETVFVIEMAAHQIGETLKSGDHRTKGVHKQFVGISHPEIRQAFFDRYGDDYDLPEAPCKPLASPLEGALKSSEGASKPRNPAPAPVLAPEALATIPLDDGSEHPVTEAEIAEYRSAYPLIDPLSECRKARAWCLGSPANRKTRRGVGKFLNGWMARAQKDAESRPRTPQAVAKSRPLL
jgi:hypothetical protein